MAAAVESHPPERHVRLYRTILAMMVPSLPLLGLLLDPATVIYDFVLCAALLGASFVVARHVRTWRSGSRPA